MNTLKVLEESYLALLRMPICSWRIRNQKVYCDLRDTIAELTNTSIQDVQEKFENLV